MNPFMKRAIEEAQKSLKHNEVPIGAVVVKDNKIVSTGRNMREKKKNALLHAEIIAINKACKKLKDWRLENCELYVTLEPCPMCAGAIANARIKKVIFGAAEKTSHDNLCQTILSSTRLNHKCEIIQDTDAENQCAEMLTTFFKNRRNSKK